MLELFAQLILSGFNTVGESWVAMWEAGAACGGSDGN